MIALEILGFLLLSGAAYLFLMHTFGFIDVSIGRDANGIYIAIERT